MTKKISLSLCVFLLLLGLFFVSNSAKAAADHYIRQGATGSGDGSDWTNAMMNIPASFVRGDTYYIANGTYSGDHVFNTAIFGSTYINVKKATVSAHGNDVGWISAYGEGVATFTGVMTVNTGYWNFDGVTGGGPGNWTSGHGFVFTSAAGANVEYFTLASGVSNVNIRHIFFTQTGNTDNFSTGASGIYDDGDLNNSIFEYLYFDNLGALPFFLRNGSGNIIQYNYSGNICGMSVADINQHCEALVIWDMDNLQFRWNYVAELPSSGGFVKNSDPNSDSIRIYGNFFGNGFPIQCNTGSCSNWRIFNNTFYNINGGPFGGDGAYSGLLFYNNLTYLADGLDSLRVAHDYNWFSRVTNGRCQTNGAVHENINVIMPADCDTYPEIFNPFVNSSGTTPESFMLAVAISNWSGVDVCSFDSCGGENKYNIDVFGNTRGVDGAWDIGAYEHGSSVVVPPGVTLPSSIGGGSSGSSGSGSSSGSSSGNSSGSGVITPAVPSVVAPVNNNKETANVSLPTTLLGVSGIVVNQVASAEAATIISRTNYVAFTSGSQTAYSKLVAQATTPTTDEQKKIIANFIQFGTPTTLILGAGERAGSVSSFNFAFKRLPVSALDWQDVIKISNGRWTTQRSATAEANAKINFKKIYLREANMNQVNDNAAVNIMAYGLRPAQRNVKSEKVAILSFKYIFKKSPVSAEEWDIIRAIAYSGAKR